MKLPRYECEPPMTPRTTPSQAKHHNQTLKPNPSNCSRQNPTCIHVAHLLNPKRPSHPPSRINLLLPRVPSRSLLPKNDTPSSQLHLLRLILQLTLHTHARSILNVQPHIFQPPQTSILTQCIEVLAVTYACVLVRGHFGQWVRLFVHICC